MLDAPGRAADATAAAADACTARALTRTQRSKEPQVGPKPRDTPKFCATVQ